MFLVHNFLIYDPYIRENFIGPAHLVELYPAFNDGQTDGHGKTQNLTRTQSLFDEALQGE